MSTSTIDLRMAAADADPDRVKEALHRVADINAAPGASGFTALHYAVSGTDCEARARVVALLHQAGADLDKCDTEKGLTALHYTAMRNKPICTEALLRCGANANAVESNGATALHGAAFYNCPEIARILLEYGGDPEQEDCHGYSPVFLAQRKGYTALVDLFEQYLAAKGKTVLGQPVRDETALRRFEDANRAVTTAKEKTRERMKGEGHPLQVLVLEGSFVATMNSAPKSTMPYHLVCVEFEDGTTLRDVRVVDRTELIVPAECATKKLVKLSLNEVQP